MFIKLLLYIKIYLFIHYNIEELIIDKKDFTITPYFYVKNNKSLTISFYEQNYEKNIFNLLEIKCKDKTKFIKINKDTFIKKFYCEKNKCFLNITFDSNNLLFNFNNDFYNNIKFKCNWKFLKIKFLVKNFIDFIKISNIQISNNIKKELEYLNPLIFVDLKQESLNSNNFKNRFGVYHGGMNGSKWDFNSKLWCEYNNESNGVDWIINNNSQYIIIDSNSFYKIGNKINNTFSVYINFDVIYKFLIKDIKNIKTTLIPIYSIYSQNLKNVYFSMLLSLFIDNNNLYLLFTEGITISKKYIIILDLNKKNNLETILKKGIGLKYLIISYITKNKYKLRVWFKNNSIFYKNSIFDPEAINMTSDFDFKIKNYYHFIGNYNYNKTRNKHYYDEFWLCYIIINEYGIFSGTEFDKVEKTDTDVYLIWDGNNKLIINNNYNLNRRSNLNNRSKILNCQTNNCILCNNNEVCLYCKKGYFWDENNNCKYNFNKNFFVNEYSELIKINIIIKNNMFISIENSKKAIINPDIIKFLKNKKHTFLNIKYEGKWNKFNELKINFLGTQNTVFVEKVNNLNYFFDNLKITNNFLTLNYDKKINNRITVLLGYKDLKNSLNKDKLTYKNLDCNNGIKYSFFFDYYYNNKFKKCYNYIKEGYYINTNYLLNCPKNCSKCRYNHIDKNIVCLNCLKGFILINNNCFFNNNFECYNNRLVDIFDNNNDKIKICDDFCNICSKKFGLICYIRNLNFDYCDKNNIIVYKSINNINLNNILTLDLINNKI